jgi:uncharacterized delta-60 repeat protein
VTESICALLKRYSGGRKTIAMRNTKIYRVISTPVLAFLALLIVGATNIKAAPGDLDPTFGQGGRVLTNIPVTGEPPGYLFYPNTESMLVQPDGKILVCGRFWQGTIEYWYGTMMVRYMPDGTLDTSFGENGKVAFVGPGFPFDNKGVGADMALQPDGKIVLIGNALNGEGVIVQRYTSAGVLDTTFGNNGITFVSGIAGEEGTSITVQPDGKIVGVGWDYRAFVEPYYNAILVFRLNTNGSPDNSFGSAGTGVVMIADGSGVEALVQPDGKILVVGTRTNRRDILPTFMIVRFNPNGSLDLNFGTGGKVIHQINNLVSWSYAAALQPDGKILVAGTTYTENLSFFVRHNTDGSLDTGFGTNGVVSVGADFFIFNYETTVLLQADGKIIATGNAYDNATGHNGFAIVRLNSNGSIDPGFGVAGRSVFPINVGGTNYADASDGAIQPDGKILVTGYFGNYYTGSHEKIALIRVDGQPSCPNPIDCNEFFVRQHYQDFLNREPDDAGLAFWTNEITSCGSEAQCVEARRINVSAAYFLSIEFQQTGYLVYRTYKAAYGNLPDAPVPIRFNEFLPDTQQIGHGVVVNQTGWETVLENNKQAFMSEFVQRPRFAGAYPLSLTPTQFVEALFANAGVTPSDTDRAAAINEFGGTLDTAAAAARARALRRVAESSALQQQEFNRAFVLMQYFGYLRRDPNAGPDAGYTGYEYWLNKLNQFNGDFVQAEMVKAFIDSSEYRRRFAP